MHTLRNLGRRKLRTTLTILGITIGIWALVVFGAMANKINSLVEGGSSYYRDKIVVTDRSNVAVGIGLTPISLSVADELAAVPGVAGAVPQIQMLIDPEGAQGFSYPEMILGQVGGADAAWETFPVSYAQGRGLTPADEASDVVVLGADLARKHQVKAGGTIVLRARTLTVIGVLEPTLTAPDTTAQLPLRAAQELFWASLPPVVRASLPAEQLASQVIVFPTTGTDTTALAATIDTAVPSVATTTGKEFDDSIGSSTAIFNAIIIGVAAISLVVGGLSVINTMAMSVAERTREIGIKRAIGATRRRIVSEPVSEAAIIGLLGGLIGLGLGALLVAFANEAGRASGTVLFDLTSGTAIFAVAFSTVLGMLAGLIPAWNAARLDPVAALRYE